MKSLPLLSLLCITLGLAHAATPPDKGRIVFLGDSITANGTYISMVEAALVAQHPDHTLEILNLGLASETVSGLSEEGHAGGKFPRPDLHERLDRVLSKTRPDLVIACYGMNDGIYFPLGEQRAAAFKDGILRLRAKVSAAGADIIHLTPPVFDPQPIRDRTLPDGLDAYPGPFAGYNGVLDAYSDWLLSMAKTEAWTVLDVHGPMNQALADARRDNPDFTFAKDGVHPNEAGHAVMARPLIEAWGLKIAASGAPDHPNGDAILDRIKKKQGLLRDAWLSDTGHLRPGVKAGLPLPEAEEKARELDLEARALARQRP